LDVASYSCGDLTVIRSNITVLEERERQRERERLIKTIANFGIQSTRTI